MDDQIHERHMSCTDDDFITGMVCGMVLADATNSPKWSWKDFLVYAVVALVTIILVVVISWIIYCRT